MRRVSRAYRGCIMQVITHNIDKTVGVVTDPDNLMSLGSFTPILLKEWAEKAIEMFGDGKKDCDCRMVHFRKTDTGFFQLYIGDTEDNIFVAVAGMTIDTPK